MIDRVEVSRALAKAIAYKECGKDRAAAAWAAQLVELLESSAILNCDAGTTMTQAGFDVVGPA